MPCLTTFVGHRAAIRRAARPPRFVNEVALLTFIIGALVTGALTPPTVRGYAAPAAYRLLDALTAQAEPPNALRGNRKN